MNDIVAAREDIGVIAGISVELITAGTAVDRVGSCSCMDRIVAIPSVELVVAVAVKDIVAVIAVQDAAPGTRAAVARSIGINRVVSRSAVDNVSASVSVDQIIRAGAGQRIGP